MKVILRYMCIFVKKYERKSSPAAMPSPPLRPPKISPYEREMTEDIVIAFIEDDDTSACRMFHGGVESAPTSLIQQRRIWPDKNDKT